MKFGIALLAVVFAATGFFLLKPRAAETPVAVEEPAPIAHSEPVPAPVSSAVVHAKAAASEPHEPIPDSLKQDLRKAIKAGDFSLANELLDQMDKLQKNSPDALSARSAILMKDNRREEALSLLQQCISTDPSNRTCLDPNVGIQMAGGSLEEEEAALKQCLAGQPNDSQCRQWLAELKMKEKNYDEAITVVQALIKDNPSAKPPLGQGNLDYLMGEALDGSGRASEAAAYYLKACQEKNKRACALLPKP